MKKMNLRAVSVTEGPIWKNMLSYFSALLLGAFFQQFYNTIDAIIVGRAVSSDALAAVGGSAATIVSLFVGFFIGLSSGATVVISQFFGAKREQEVEKSVHTAIALAIAGGLFFSVIGVAISPWIINKMGTPPETVEASVMYLRIFFLGMIPNLVYNMGAGILRAVGDSRRPLYILVISCFANIFLDIFFVIVLGLGKQGNVSGVIGVAVATVLCQLLSAVIVIIALMRSVGSYRLKIQNIRFDAPILKRIISIGLPAGFQTTMYTVSNILIQSAINGFGTDTAAAWAAYGKIDVIFWMTMSSLCTSVTTFTGQNYGAGNYERVKRSIRTAFIIAIIITIPLSSMLVVFGDKFLYIFVTNTNVIRIGVQMINFLAPFYITYICVEVFSGALRGMGEAITPMIITLSGVCLLRVAWILIAFPMNKTIEMVELSYPITWTTTSILYVIYYFRYKRKKGI
ncbi:MAG: MATE family efflux transporter [Butyrivibrio sp.]|nr:MATE family efflux transporter [Butyrivibrio sp.]